MLRTVMLWALFLAGCFPTDHNYDYVRPLTPGEEDAAFALLRSGARLMAANAASALQAAAGSPGAWQSPQLNTSISCPSGGQINVTGESSATCPANGTPGACNIQFNLGLASDDRPTGASPCVFPNDEVFQLVFTAGGRGTDAAYSIPIGGVFNLNQQHDGTQLVYIGGCVVQLTLSEPGGVLSGTFCERQVNELL
jgi:hypothetical protein